MNQTIMGLPWVVPVRQSVSRRKNAICALERRVAPVDGGKILEPGAFEHDAGLADTGVAAERRCQSGRRVGQDRRVGERAGDFLGMRAARESERTAPARRAGSFEKKGSTCVAGSNGVGRMRGFALKAPPPWFQYSPPVPFGHPLRGRRIKKLHVAGIEGPPPCAEEAALWTVRIRAISGSGRGGGSDVGTHLHAVELHLTRGGVGGLLGGGDGFAEADDAEDAAAGDDQSGLSSLRAVPAWKTICSAVFSGSSSMTAPFSG